MKQQNSVPSLQAQKEIWSSAKLSEESNCAFNMLRMLLLAGKLDDMVLEAALQDIIGRYESLRCTFSRDGDTFSIHSACRHQVIREDFSVYSQEEQQQMLSDLVHREASTPFDLQHGPLLRIILLRLAPEKHRLLIIFHSIIFDDRSFGIFFRDLATSYNAEKQGTRPQLLSTAHLSQCVEEVKKRRISGSQGEKDLVYWVGRLTPVPEPVEIPSLKARPLQRSYSSKRRDYVIREKEIQRLKQFADALDMSVEYVILSSLAIFFSRICHQDDIIIGVMAPGAESDDTLFVGHNVTLLPLRFQIKADVSFEEQLRTCGQVLIEAFEHRNITYGTLVKKLHLPRDPARTPLFSILCNISHPADDVLFEGLDCKVITPPRSFEQFELSFDISRNDKGVSLCCQYNTALFDESIIALYLDGLGELLKVGLENPRCLLRELPLISQDERHLLLERLNDTDLPLAADKTILDLFREAVRQHADKAAIVFKDITLSYGELDRLSDILAAKILAKGGGKGTLVGIYLQRSHKMFIAILGVLKSGSGYVPLDPAFPHDRLQYMIDDSGIVALVTEQGQPVNQFNTNAVLIDIDRDMADTSPAGNAVLLDSVPDSSDIGYVIYTSGSTGKPKGVAVPHLGILNLLVSMRRSPGMSEHDRLLALTTLSFDMAVPELYLPLITGATIFVAGKEDVTDGGRLVQLLKENRITFLQATPSTWRMLITAGWQGDARLKALIGGEALPQPLAFELAPMVKELWNMYGPTETTVWSTAYLVPKDGSKIFIGRPIGNTQLYVMNDSRQLLPRGVPGELYIGGAGVTKGYMNREELTRKAFIPNPLAPPAKDIIYRTGDLVRYHLNGNLEYISRLDNQVKLRGYRIELGEIEKAIATVTGIKEVVVNIFSMSEDDKRLIAYIKREGTIDLDFLKSELSSMVPGYMLPQHYVLLETFPLTVNGKINRKALPGPVHEETPQHTLVEPRNDFEYSLLEVWKKTLNVDHIGITDNFFDIGGHSLLALTLVNEMKKATGIEIEYGAIFNTPTIKDLVQNLGVATSKQASSVVALQPEGAGTPIFCLCGISLYQDLAVSLGKEQPVYAVYVDEEQALLEQAARGRVAEVSIKKLAEAYLKAILRQQPDGPYQLIGISFGGIVAVETARLLQDKGKEVRVVVLLDTILPGGRKKKTFGVLKHHVQKIRREGIGYFLSRSKQKVRKALYRQPWMVRKGGMKDEQDAKNEQIVLFRELAYLQAMDDYQGKVKPYSGEVVLLRAEEKWGDEEFIEYRPDYGWREYVRGRLTIFDVPGDHLGIISPPCVQTVVERLHPFLRHHTS